MTCARHYGVHTYVHIHRGQNLIGTIIKREFLDNIQTFKFIACVLVAIVVSLASTSILTRDYQDRLKNYDKGVALAKEALTKVPVYSSLKVRIFRKPTPLSIFVAGIERKAGSYAEIPILGMDIPTSLQGGITKNEFAAAFSIFDFFSVIIIIFTVLAILLTYGAVSGEKEDGLLSLALSYSVPRSKILFGKYLGALVSVAVPLLLCFILGVLFVVGSKNVEVDATFFGSMAFLFSASLLYLSCILVVGLLASARTKTSFSSLLFLLTFYLVFTFLIPQAVKSYANNAISARMRSVESNIRNLVNEGYKKRGEAYQTAAFKKTWVIPRDGDNMQLYGGIILKRITSPEFLEDQNITNSYMLRTEREYAQKVYNLKEQDMAVVENTRRAQNKLLAFVPSSSFGRIAELAADTGDESLKRYLRQINLYWHQYMSYLDQKNAFGTRFFYPGPDELTAYEKNLIKRITEDRSGLMNNMGVAWLVRYHGKFYDEAIRYKPQLTFLNLDDLPAFRAPEAEFAYRLKPSLFSIGILFFYNVLFFALTYFSFAKYDPRRTD
jgi:ABC-type transport system involved in multi-copper enzyme maturation permease subunit